MAKPQEQLIEKMGDDIYNSLKEIQKEEQVKLGDKAFIADFLSEKLHTLGYKSPSEIPAIERAAMERVFEKIEKLWTTYECNWFQDIKFQALRSSLLGKEDKGK